MRLARAEQIQEIDRLATQRYGIPSSELMDNAGSAIARWILEDRSWSRKRDVWILCGPGKNGGDGQVIARRLRESGAQVRVWPRETESNHLHPSDFANVVLPDVSDLAEASLIVDSMFGVGLNRPIEGLFRELILRINSSRARVIAVDLPSGLDANRGIAMNVCVRAHVTLTCGLAKPGFFLQDGPGLSGEIHVLKIGFPEILEKEIARDTFLIGRASARRLLPQIPSPTANKSKFGRVLIIGGDAGMEGAALLSAVAAARAGAGYVTLSTPEVIPFDRKPPDFLTLSWKEMRKADFTDFQSIVIGPGLGDRNDRLGILKKVVSSGVKSVIDADALNLLSKHSEIRLHHNCVITPHAGELARFISIEASEIERDRLRFARAASLARGSVALLKGYRTVVDDGLKSWIVNSGNVSLAKAGSGDVLSGFIAGFAAQGLSILDAAVIGAFLHGDIADRWVRSGFGSRTLMASDLPRLIRKAWKGAR